MGSLSWTCLVEVGQPNIFHIPYRGFGIRQTARQIGLTTVNMPSRDPDSGVPIGVMAMGEWGTEEDLIAFARDGEPILDLQPATIDYNLPSAYLDILSLVCAMISSHTEASEGACIYLRATREAFLRLSKIPVDVLVKLLCCQPELLTREYTI
jgi:hypothetical protein